MSSIGLYHGLSVGELSKSSTASASVVKHAHSLNDDIATVSLACNAMRRGKERWMPERFRKWKDQRKSGRDFGLVWKEYADYRMLTGSER